MNVGYVFNTFRDVDSFGFSTASGDYYVEIIKF